MAQYGCQQFAAHFTNPSSSFHFSVAVRNTIDAMSSEDRPRLEIPLLG
jgi:hypothetical protein